jgi:hypothetical protein
MAVENDKIGVVRDHRWIKAGEQRKRLEAEGCRGVLDITSVASRSDIVKMACQDRVFVLVHAFLLADPRARGKKGGMKADLAAFIKEIDKRGAAVKDMETGLTTEQPEHRKAILALAYAHIARSNQGLKSNLNGARSKGRPRSWDDPAARKIIWDEWHSAENRTNKQASEKAGARLERYVSPNTMWKIVEAMRRAKGLEGKGASGRRPNSASSRVAAIGTEDLNPPKPPPPLKGVVYFLKNGERDRVKIGFSSRYSARHATLQGASCDDLTLLGTIPGNLKLERKMHTRFKAQRIHPRREWFRVEGALAKFLKTLSKPKAK